jgi:hypothetical protein
MNQQIYLITSGDLRQSANEICWPAQHELEQTLTRVIADAGYELIRAFPYNTELKHGFISSQRMGMNIFQGIPAGAPLIFATAAWQYTHHVLPGLRTHKGPPPHRCKLVTTMARPCRHPSLRRDRVTVERGHSSVANDQRHH